MGAQYRTQFGGMTNDPTRCDQGMLVAFFNFLGQQGNNAMNQMNGGGMGMGMGMDMGMGHGGGGMGKGGGKGKNNGPFAAAMGMGMGMDMGMGGPMKKPRMDTGNPLV